MGVRDAAICGTGIDPVQTADSFDMTTHETKIVSEMLAPERHDLPIGGLTVIDLQSIWEADLDWQKLASRLVTDQLACGRPVLWVECGGFDRGIGDVLSRQIDDERFEYTADDDVTVVVPSRDGSVDFSQYLDSPDAETEDVPARYNCGVPTLATIAARLARLDVHGPTTIVLDAVEDARPYWHTADRDPGFSRPGWFQPSWNDAHLWRANDFKRFAESRPNGITVAILSTDHGRAELLQAAARVLSASDAPNFKFEREPSS